MDRALCTVAHFRSLLYLLIVLYMQIRIHTILHIHIMSESIVTYSLLKQKNITIHLWTKLNKANVANDNYSKQQLVVAGHVLSPLEV